MADRELIADLLRELIDRAPSVTRRHTAASVEAWRAALDDLQSLAAAGELPADVAPQVEAMLARTPRARAIADAGEIATMAAAALAVLSPPPSD